VLTGIGDPFQHMDSQSCLPTAMKKPHDCKKTIQIRGANGQVLAVACEECYEKRIVPAGY
jgi:hypothetical protein